MARTLPTRTILATPALAARVLALALAPLALGPAAAAQNDGSPLRIYGFEPTAEGQASLAIESDPEAGDKLKISNLGSSGCDGFSIDLGTGGGDSDGAYMRLEDMTPGTYAMVTNGSVPGLGSGPRGELSVTVTDAAGTGPSAAWSADYSNLGSATYTCRIWNGGYLMGEVPGITAGDDIIVDDTPNVTIYYVENIGTDDQTYHCKVFLDEVVIEGIMFSGGGFTALDVDATALQFIPDSNPGDDVTLESMTAMFTDTGEVTVSLLGMEAFGSQVRGEGEAQLGKESGKLKISNLGSSGCDGFSIDLGGNSGMGEHTAGVDFSIDATGTAPAPGTTSYQVLMGATVDGELHEDFASITVTDDGSGSPASLEFGCDPKMLATIWYYEVYDDEVLMESGRIGGNSFTVDSFFDVEIDWCRGTEPDGDEVLEAVFSSDVSISVNGGASLTVDRLVMGIDAADAWRVSDSTKATVTVTGVPEIFVTGITESPRPYTNKGNGNSNSGHITLIKAPLVGGGGLGGGLNGLILADAPPSSLCLLFVGFAENPTPFKGGTLLPIPAFLEVTLFTSPAGGISLPFATPGGLPGGTEIHMQYAVADALAPTGVWISNALTMTSP